MSEPHTLGHSSIRIEIVRERERESERELFEYIVSSLELEMACKYAMYKDAYIL